MTKDDLHVGILGCANIAKKYAIPALKSNQHISKITIASRDFNKAKQWAKEMQITAALDYQSVLDDPSIDAVYIPLPIALHEQWCIAAAQARKHIICEKALTTSLESANAIFYACKETKVQLFENYICLHHPLFTTLKSIIDSGKLGKIYSFEGAFGFPYRCPNDFRYNPELGGSGLLDAGVYPLYLTLALFPGKIKRVAANFHTQNKVDMSGSILMQLGDIDISIHFGFQHCYRNEHTIWGEKGILKTSPAYSIAPEQTPKILLITNRNMQTHHETIPCKSANQFSNAFDTYINAIISNQPTSTDTLLRRIKIIDQILNATYETNTTPICI